VAALIDAEPGDVVFTSGGTEANNLALRGLPPVSARAHIVTTAIEHASILDTCAALARTGYEISRVGVDAFGRVDPEAVESAMRPDTTLVSLALANNEVGVIQPVAEISRATRARGVPLHVDAAQAAGKIPVSVDALGADLLTLSAHKLGGPQGIGALYVRPGIRLQAQLSGGPQERQRRAGTENVIGTVGFGAAARLAAAHLTSEAERQSALIERLWRDIQAAVPDAQRNGASPAESVPNTLSVSFPGADADALVIGLDLWGIAVSAGSACDAGSLQPSHVLLAMGRSFVDARSALRVSIGYDTTADELARFVEVLPEVVARSRGAAAAAGRP
jgi:cysteine desulfurase